MRYLSLWFGGILGLTPEEFRNQYGSQLGRIVSASAASNAGIPVELWVNMVIGILSKPPKMHET
jgi:hypothetical protein